LTAWRSLRINKINENMKATDDFKKYLNSILNKVDDEIHNELWNRLIDIIKENESKLRQGAVSGTLPTYNICGGCGADNPSKRCIGCRHVFGNGH
jgi:hypothetical protein